ncbi:MAG TPA: hypothetical protein PKC39_03600 [Ferruginibacter sp.]|nr:hypothetical protein [Ferruginibacter sp.]HMP20024.1 hypothetical protein [Ferruginibacter sp.]
MNIIRLAIELFVLYVLYKLVFDLIIPAARTTKQVKKQFNEMNARMQDQMHRQQENAYQQRYTNTPNTGKAAGSSDDYIEFEEVK